MTGAQPSQYLPGDPRLAEVLARPLGGVDYLIRGEQGYRIWFTGRAVAPELLNSNGSIRESLSWSASQTSAPYGSFFPPDSTIFSYPESHMLHNDPSVYNGKAVVPWMVKEVAERSLVELPPSNEIGSFITTDAEWREVMELYRVMGVTPEPFSSPQTPALIWLRSLVTLIWLRRGSGFRRDQSFDGVGSPINLDRNTLTRDLFGGRQEPIGMMDVAVAAKMLGDSSLADYTLPQFVFLLAHSHLWEGLNPSTHAVGRRGHALLTRGYLWEMKKVGLALSNVETLAWAVAASHHTATAVPDEHSKRHEVYQCIVRLMELTSILDVLDFLREPFAGADTVPALTRALEAINGGLALTLNDFRPYFAHGITDIEEIARAKRDGIGGDLLASMMASRN